MGPTGRRKLAAILMADVAEYGRHMGEDESGAIRTLTALSLPKTSSALQ